MRAANPNTQAYNLSPDTREDFPADADGILHDNAREVLRRVFAGRSRA
jgi:hypothetical protein